VNDHRDAPTPHRGLAEQGKIHAVAGDHDLALAHYREAMRLVVETGGPEVFHRHYLECSIESLELMGAIEAVIDHCLTVEERHAALDPGDELSARSAAIDRATNAQRLGANLFKAERLDEAAEVLDRSLAGAADNEVALPLAEALLDWLHRGVATDRARIETEQRRHGYFAVTADSLNPSAATPLPTEPASTVR